MADNFVNQLSGKKRTAPPLMLLSAMYGTYRRLDPMCQSPEKVRKLLVERTRPSTWASDDVYAEHGDILLEAERAVRFEQKWYSDICVDEIKKEYRWINRAAAVLERLAPENQRDAVKVIARRMKSTVVRRIYARDTGIDDCINRTWYAYCMTMMYNATWYHYEWVRLGLFGLNRTQFAAASKRYPYLFTMFGDIRFRLNAVVSVM